MPWTRAKAAAAPFGEAAWDQARRLLGPARPRPGHRGRDRPGRRRLARQGRTRSGGQNMPSKKDQRAAARARAAAVPGWPRPDTGLRPGRAGRRPWQRTGHRTPAEVIPLPIFDPFAEPASAGEHLVSDSSPDRGHLQLATVSGWRRFAADMPAVPQLLAGPERAVLDQDKRARLLTRTASSITPACWWCRHRRCARSSPRDGG